MAGVNELGLQIDAIQPWFVAEQAQQYTVPFWVVEPFAPPKNPIVAPFALRITVNASKPSSEEYDVVLVCFTSS